MPELIVFIFSVIVAVIATYFVRKIGMKLHIGSLPDQRKIHVGFVPHLGGIGIFFGGIAGLIIAVFLYGPDFDLFNTKYLAVFAGSTLLLLTGMYDDMHGISARTKFIMQIIASTIVIISGCVVDRIVNPFGNPIELHIFAIPVTYLWLIGVTNAINLLDGLDGLAGGIGFIALATLFILSIIAIVLFKIIYGIINL